jgi:hypothetical protein
MELPDVPFEVWKQQLLHDCTRRGLLAFTALGESVLHVLWAAGIEPSVNGIIQAVSFEEEKAGA